MLDTLFYTDIPVKSRQEFPTARFYRFARNIKANLHNSSFQTYVFSIQLQWTQAAR